MVPVKTLTAIVLAVLATAAAADPLADMAGAWQGSGWARQTPQGPQETVRCRIENRYDEDAGELSINGRCAVPGRQLTLAGRLSSRDGSDRVSGRWFNPDGIGSVPVTGRTTDHGLRMTFSASDPDTGADISQAATWELTGDGLTLRSVHTGQPEVGMADLTFSR
ncbi:hypothetical protein BOO69_14440 [Sulfitobacter alexandrii]|uniref:DUF3617 family protein n=1 Tax=Sulfitobacter alexandrii TaxID=1917485 RepID=A0A1J0WJZ9_9RHOB|nr:hypothetical protein [Sulfitobacter alexandrii]APE44478.1 hypothetical protein BOO69_14440 [Sulfitobacter alexandrii]